MLVDTEARWENMRKVPGVDSEVPDSLTNLQGRQKAYEAFRAKLAAYNRRYTPLHTPELLLNSPSRLGIWCRKMRDLYLQIEHTTQAHRPEHLLEKAYRLGDRISVRLNRALTQGRTRSGTIRNAIEELEAMEQWCATCEDRQHACQPKAVVSA